MLVPCAWRHAMTGCLLSQVGKLKAFMTLLAEVPEEKNLTDLLDLPKRKNVLVNSLDAVVDFVEAKVGGGQPAAKKAKK